MRDVPGEVSVLEYLAKRVTARRNQHLEDMAKGQPPNAYEQLVGRGKENLALLEEITALQTRLREGDIDDTDEDFGNEPDGTQDRPSPAQRRSRSGAR
jgi:hypothetical protein